MNTTGYTCQCPSPYFGVNCTEFPTTTTTPTPPTTPLQTTVPPVHGHCTKINLFYHKSISGSIASCSTYRSNRSAVSRMYRSINSGRCNFRIVFCVQVQCYATYYSLWCNELIFCHSFFRIISLERMLHMFQEVALFTGHCIIFFTMKIKLTGVKQSLFKLHPRVILIYIGLYSFQSSCSYVGIFLQYTFLVNFAFLTLETLQTFSVLQNVVSIGGFFSWKVNLLIGLLAPAGITLVTAISSFKHYPSTYS